MKKRHLIRIVSLFLIFGLLLPTASAATQVQPRYVKIDTLTSELLSISWLGKATCCGSVSIWDATCNVEFNMHLQRSETGSSWTTVKTWSDTSNGRRTVALEKSWYVTSGYYYRVVTTAIVYDANGYLIEGDAAKSAVFLY